MEEFVPVILLFVVMFSLVFFLPTCQDYVVFVDDQEGVFCDQYEVVDNTHEICLTLFDGTRHYVSFNDSYCIEIVKFSLFDDIRGSVSWR